MANSKIKQFYKDKCIFVTGATGFLGKILMEKLLRDCENIAYIYFLIRIKSNSTLNETLDKFKNHQIFDRIRCKENGAKLLNKLQPIVGDITQSNYNLTLHDINVLNQNVNVIFHCAASVKFNDSVQDAVLLNTCATQQLLEMAKQMKGLKSFLYVSTAFSNVNHKYIKEIVYTPVMDYKLVIEACLKNDTLELELIRREIQKHFPNTYVFTKNLAEQIVYDAKNEIPIGILRPSIGKIFYVKKNY